MANPRTVYYTFRKVSGSNEPLRVECMKWDSMVSEEVPLETYKVSPDNPGYWGACSCPAMKTCKHYKCVLEAKEAGNIDTLYEWMWTERGGWSKLDDIRPIGQNGPSTAS